MRLGRIGLNAYNVIDSKNLERDLGEKPIPTFRIPLWQICPNGAFSASNPGYSAGACGERAELPRLPPACAVLCEAWPTSLVMTKITAKVAT